MICDVSVDNLEHQKRGSNSDHTAGFLLSWGSWKKSTDLRLVSWWLFCNVILGAQMIFGFQTSLLIYSEVEIPILRVIH